MIAGEGPCPRPSCTRLVFQALARIRGFFPRGTGIKVSTRALVLIGLSAAPSAAVEALAADLPDAFVHLADIDPSIRGDIRYAGSANFLGRPARGYEAPVCILTKEAAAALSKAQKALAGDGLTLVVFDCYRPASAVVDFVDWTKLGGPADPQWHPHVTRDDLVAKGYVGAQSSHTRGSTVDLAIASLTAPAAPRMQCGTRDADTLDFGSGFDCFDPISETGHPGLTPEARANRALLVKTMRAAGFRNYSKEWWHFTLRGEPFPKQRFDFPVR